MNGLNCIDIDFRFYCLFTKYVLRCFDEIEMNKANGYRIDTYRTPAFYKNMIVLNGVIFEICGVLIKFLLKKWTFRAKRRCFIQICPKWHSNQDWPSIRVDTVLDSLKEVNRQPIFIKRKIISKAITAKFSATSICPVPKLAHFYVLSMYLLHTVI